MPSTSTKRLKPQAELEPPKGSAKEKSSLSKAAESADSLPSIQKKLTRVNRQKTPKKTADITALPHAIRDAVEIAKFADDKKAERISILDIRDLSTFADVLVICSGNSEPHLKAIASAIREGMREHHGRIAHSEDGIPASQWVVIDYVDVVVHIFMSHLREFYGLEELWGDAPRVPFPLETSKTKASRTTRSRRPKTIGL